jgi:hypothetical protein
VPVKVVDRGGTHTVKVNQKTPPKDGKALSLGVFDFAAGEAGYVEVSNAGTTGHVIVDAVRWVPAK